MIVAGVMGDTHGNTKWVQYALDLFKRRGISRIVQLGDFGIWPGESGALFLKAVRLELEKNDQTLYFVDGNHEDFDQLLALPVQEDGLRKVRNRIYHLPRGLRWEWDGVTFVALGGAPSVDRTYREQFKGKSKAWWPQEMLSEADVELASEGGKVDVMLAHDAPFVESVSKHIAGNPFGFKQRDLDYAYDGRKLMDKAVRAIKPRVFLHGHYHHLLAGTLYWSEIPFARMVTSTTQTLGFDKDDANFSLGAIHTDETGDEVYAEAWDIRADYNAYRFNRHARETERLPPGWRQYEN